MQVPSPRCIWTLGVHHLYVNSSPYRYLCIHCIERTQAHDIFFESTIVLGSHICVYVQQSMSVGICTLFLGSPFCVLFFSQDEKAVRQRGSQDAGWCRICRGQGFPGIFRSWVQHWPHGARTLGKNRGLIALGSHWQCYVQLQSHITSPLSKSALYFLSAIILKISHNTMLARSVGWNLCDSNSNLWKTVHATHVWIWRRMWNGLSKARVARLLNSFASPRPAWRLQTTLPSWKACLRKLCLCVLLPCRKSDRMW